jgi:hypothetical protein
MKQENSKRIVQTHDFTLKAKANQIFPLLCPTREYDWIENWSCQLIYSESGMAENNCIFLTALEGESKLIWTVSRYEPFSAIEFVIVGDGITLKLDLHLSESIDGTTSIRVAHTITGLNEEGNTVVEALHLTSLKTGGGVWNMLWGIIFKPAGCSWRRNNACIPSVNLLQNMGYREAPCFTMSESGCWPLLFESATTTVSTQKMMQQCLKRSAYFDMPV